MSAFGSFSDLSAKVLNSTEDAHVSNKSAFETEEIFRRSIGGGTPSAESIMIVWEDPIVPPSAKPLTNTERAPLGAVYISPTI
jgi:hypothetical protein